MQAAMPLACFLSMIRPPGIQFENSLLQIAPVDKAKCPFVRDHNDIEFRLYTRHNPTVYQELYIDDDEKLFASNLDYHAPTVLFFHAFMENPDDGSAAMVREAYVLRGDTNVIMVDASRLEAGPWYFTAAENTWYIGRFAAQFVDYLVSRGLNLNNTHFVGHSLGAQAAGVAGSALKTGRVSRITGLDPALPLFHGLRAEQRLDTSDADFVDIIHTDGGIFGVNRPMGHADFYPNGGISPQPGCELEVVIPQQMLLNKCDINTAPRGYYAFYLTPHKITKNSIILEKKLQKFFTRIQAIKSNEKTEVQPLREPNFKVKRLESEDSLKSRDPDYKVGALESGKSLKMKKFETKESLDIKNLKPQEMMLKSKGTNSNENHKTSYAEPQVNTQLKEEQQESSEKLRNIDASDQTAFEDQIMVESVEKYRVLKPDFLKTDELNSGTMKPVITKKNDRLFAESTDDNPKENINKNAEVFQKFTGTIKPVITKKNDRLFVESSDDNPKETINKKNEDVLEEFNTGTMKPVITKQNDKVLVEISDDISKETINKNAEVIQEFNTGTMKPVITKKNDRLFAENSDEISKENITKKNEQVSEIGEIDSQDKTPNSGFILDIEPLRLDLDRYLMPPRTGRYYRNFAKKIGTPRTIEEVTITQMPHYLYQPQVETQFESKPEEQSQLDSKDKSQIDSKPQKQSFPDSKPQEKSQTDSKLQEKSQSHSKLQEKSQIDSKPQKQTQFDSKPEYKSQSDSKHQEKSQSDGTRYKNHVFKRQKRFLNPFKGSETDQQDNFLFKLLDFVFKHRSKIPVYSVMREINTLVKSAHGELNHISKERNNYIGAPPPTLIPVSYTLELANENKVTAFVKKLLGLAPKGDRLTINGK